MYNITDKKTLNSNGTCQLNWYELIMRLQKNIRTQNSLFIYPEKFSQ